MKQPCRLLFASILAVGLSHVAIADPEPVKPFPPFHIAGNLYYVGNEDLAEFLVVTPKGNILINTDYENNVPLINASIRKLGFNVKDTKIILLSQAHIDHDGGSALIKKQTGAAYMVMDADVPVVESGGKADFQYAHDSDMLYPAVKVDRVLHDGDTVKLGNAVLVAHLTPGHTKGCTTWTMKLNDHGKSYNVVIVGGTYVNPGYKLVHNTTYPTIASDYKHTFQILKSLPCDIFLGAHGSYFNLVEKYARLNKQAGNPFVDPVGYKTFVAGAEKDFETELAKQQVSSR